MTTKPENVEAPDYSQYIEEEPLWSEILPNLWQGGTHDNDVIGDDTYAKPFTMQKAFITPEHFDTVVTLYQYANPVDWFVKEYRYCVYDWNIEHMDIRELHNTAKFAHAEWKSGKKTLIRCQAGLNRSGLVMALVLMLEGYTASEAITLIRSRRAEYALFNEEFEKYLLNLNPTELV